MWALSWMAAAGCSSNMAKPDGGPLPDSGRDGSPDTAVDASTCSCTKVDGELFTIRLSWSCFCAEYGCPATTQADLCNWNTWSSACGLTVASFETAGGVQKTAFDATGTVVGRRYATDVYQDTCHGAPIGFAAVESGELPDASCAAVPCSCAGGVVTCPAADAGGP
jgi:hypothetical protein